jgi:alanine racemase
VDQVTRRASGRPILAVIKNNGYGMGLIETARLLAPLPAIHGFAVVKLHEAITLRDSGVKKPIVLMGPFDEANLGEAAARDIMPMVYTPIGAALERQATKRQRTIAVHICVDTGLGRVGVPHAHAATLVRDLAARRSLRIDGMMMTFSEDPELDKSRFDVSSPSATALSGTRSRSDGNIPRRASGSSSTHPRFSTWCGRAWRCSASTPSSSSGSWACSICGQRWRCGPGWRTSSC